MQPGRNFEKRYRNNDTPWELGRPDRNLVEMVKGKPLGTCKALEIGCGRGANAIWLAQQGFEVTACDASPTAIERAIARAGEAGVKCAFLTTEFLQSTISGRPFGFVFDRGCFHSFDSDEDRRKFADNVSSHLTPGGLWLSLIGNADDEHRDKGPPRRTAETIVRAIEPFFEIISLNSGHFDSNNPVPARAWICLVQKREVK